MSRAARLAAAGLASAFLAACASTAPTPTPELTAAPAPESADDATDRIAFFVHHARNGECDAVLKAIDAGTPIDAVDPLDQTALVAAVSQHHEDCAKALLDRNASVATRDPAGWTPLMFAVYFDAPLPFVGELLKHGADINAQNDRGVTSLHLAAGAGNEPLVALLLGQGANRELATKSGYTPLRLAQTKGLKHIVTLLETPLPVAGSKSATGAATARASAP